MSGLVPPGRFCRYGWNQAYDRQSVSLRSQAGRVLGVVEIEHSRNGGSVDVADASEKETSK